MEWVIGAVVIIGILLYLGHRENRRQATSSTIGPESLPIQSGATFDPAKPAAGRFSTITFDEQRANAWLDIVGESHYQDNIAFYAGKRTPDGPEHLEHTAMLLPEPTNQHDPNAIVVCFVRSPDGAALPVGYLSRQNAVAYRPVIERVRPHTIVTTALVHGGWDRGNGDTGSYGIRLNLGPPDELLAELDGLPIQTRPARKSPTMPVYDPAVSDEVLEDWDGDYEGRSVCFTAPSMHEFRGQRVTRSMQELLATQHGMDVRPSVTKGLDILVVGNGRPATRKLRKAVEYGATIVDEVTFWERLGVSFET